MNSRDFTYWLQGFFELSNDNVTLSRRQLNIIKDHLDLVFRKETPDRSTEEGGDEDILSSPPPKDAYPFKPWKVPTYIKWSPRDKVSLCQDTVNNPLGSDPSDIPVSC